MDHRGASSRLIYCACLLSLPCFLRHVVVWLQLVMIIGDRRHDGYVAGA